MSDEVFRIVITAGVGVASLAFVAMAVVAWSFHRTAQRIQQKVEALTVTIEPMVSKAGPVLEKLAPVVESAGPVIMRIGPLMDKAGKAFEQIGGLVERTGPAVEDARRMIGTVNRVVEDTRPRIAEVAGEAMAIARTGREQVERVGTLIHDAADRARDRLEQIDETVDNTVEQVERVGDNVKRAVLRPVREVNGFAAGVSAAFSALVNGRKSSVDSATLDEEMFI